VLVGVDDADFPAVCRNDLADDGQSHAGAARARRDTGLEDAFVLVGRDTRTVVGDEEAVGRDADAHGQPLTSCRARGTVFHGVLANL